MKGSLFIAGSATGFGLMPVFAVYAYGDGLTVATLLCLRFAIAAAAFMPYVWWRARRTRRRLSGRDVRRLIVLGGVLYATQSALYFTSVRHISPALAALLLYLYPGMVASADAVLSRRRPSPVVVASTLVSFAGVVLALGPQGGRVSVTGVFLAVGAAAVYTVYILYGDRVGGGVEPVTMTAFVSLFASASFLLYGLATGGLRFSFAARGWLPLLAVALASTVVAITFFFLGMALIGPTNAAIGSMLEPVVSIAAAAALLGGALTGLQLLGAALVLTGATVGVLSRRTRDAGAGAPAREPERERGAVAP